MLNEVNHEADKDILEKIKELMLKMILEGKNENPPDDAAPDEEMGEKRDPTEEIGGESEVSLGGGDDEEESSGEPDDLKSMISGFMKKGRNLPSKGKGTAVMMASMKKSPKKALVK